MIPLASPILWFIQRHSPEHSHGQSAFCILTLTPHTQSLCGHLHLLRAVFVTSTTGLPLEQLSIAVATQKQNIFGYLSTLSLLRSLFLARQIIHILLTYYCRKGVILFARKFRFQQGLRVFPCVSVCQQNNSRTTEQVYTKICRV